MVAGELPRRSALRHVRDGASRAQRRRHRRRAQPPIPFRLRQRARRRQARLRLSGRAAGPPARELGRGPACRHRPLRPVASRRDGDERRQAGADRRGSLGAQGAGRRRRDPERQSVRVLRAAAQSGDRADLQLPGAHRRTVGAEPRGRHRRRCPPRPAHGGADPPAAIRRAAPRGKRVRSPHRGANQGRDRRPRRPVQPHGG